MENNDQDCQDDHQVLPFPPEIFLGVCSYLEPSEVRSLRLCCKALANIGACCGFRCIVFHLHKPDFDKLLSIARHPIISKNVDTLIYEIANLVQMGRNPPYYSPEHYERLTMIRSLRRKVKRSEPNWIPDGVLDTIPITPIPFEHLQENYNRYKNAVKEQHHILSTKADLDLLEDVIPKLTGLKKIIVNDGYSISQIRQSPFDAFFAQAEPVNMQSLQAIMHGLSCSKIQLHSFEANQLHPSLINALFFAQITTSCKGLKSISLDFTGEDAYINRDDAPFILNTLQLVNHGALPKLLGSLPSLKHLCIIFDNVIRGLVHPYPFHSVVSPKSRWRNLREIRLDRIQAERPELSAFFELHRLTLERIHLHECALATTSWIKLLWQMKRTLKLKEIWITGDALGRFEEGEDCTHFNQNPDDTIQCWAFGWPWSDRWCLAMDVANWFLLGTPCPLNPAEYWMHPDNDDATE
ncbi:hypothetical protein F4804DRAFT_322068 [Jackrogersella minutella]|nr:hypothetical protein F4804DRAFT_322068 [Jackrogersella minutella]